MPAKGKRAIRTTATRYNSLYEFENERFLVHCTPGGPDGRAVGADARARPAATPPTHAGQTDIQSPGRSRHERHHRPRRQGQLRPRPEEGRIRDLRRRRQAGHLVDDGRHRRARDQRAGAAAAAAAGGHHPAADAAAHRRVGPHLPVLRRRSASAVPQHRPRPRAVQEDLEGAGARRRHVRHRLERSFVDRRST